MRTHLRRLANVSLLLTMLFSQLALSGNVSASPSFAQAVQTGPSIQVEESLAKEFDSKGSAGYLIYFHPEAELNAASKMNWEERGQFVLESLQQDALEKQAKTRAYLDAQGVKYQSFWIDNVIVVEASSKQVFNHLLNFPEIQSLKARRTMGIIEPEQRSAPDTAQLFAIESNLSRINADDVWTMGYEGTGVTIANIDTGARYTHLALNAQYRGNLGGGTYDHNYNWFDPYGTYTYPADTNGHGTHTMGTMVGDDGGANQVGVAPGANWMACRGCSTSSCTDAALLACAQFIAAPTDLAGANPDPAKRPVAVNNSWGDCGSNYDNWYQGVVNAWQAAGIFPIFSNGNASNCGYSSPPGLNTVGNPARYGNVIGVGSTGQSNGQYATHSNWGPTDNPDTINPNPSDAFGAALKPQVVAPGVNIRSSVQSGDSAYASYSGTSMSAPHVTGLVALIVEAAPCLAGDYATIETIMENTAVPISYATGGAPAPPPGNAINYATGHGEIDALAAVNMALNMCGSSVLSGTVTSSANGNPLEGVRVDIDTSPARHTTTDTDGFYSLNLLDGTYNLTFSKYGYITKTITDVNLAGTATQNAALDTAPISTVSGIVTDALTGWPLYARIEIAGAPGDPVFTNPVTGAYSVNLVDASYTFTVSAMSGGYVNTVTPVTVSGDATQDFDLNANTSLAACNAPGYQIIPGTTIFSDGFDTSTTPDFSADWDKVDVSNTAGDWTTRTSTWHPSGGTPHSAPNLAVFNSWTASSSSSTRLYRTSGEDLSALSSAEVSFWMYHDTGYSLNDRVQVQISTDGGTTWTDVDSPISRYNGTVGWSKHTVNLNAYTGASMTDVQVGFLGISSYGNDIHIDDMTVSTATVCQPVPDTGLVVGSVFDAITGLLLTEASVQDAALKPAQFMDASADPATPDLVYVIAELAGPVTLTASATGYGNDIQTPTVIAGDTVGQNFNLGSSSLAHNPSTLQATLVLGDSEIQTLTLTNTGGLPATFELIERNGGFTPASVNRPREVTQPAGPHAVDARKAPSQAGLSAPVYGSNPNAILISEGFEGGVVPPTGWAEVVNNASYNWKVATLGTPYAGTYAADVEYDPSMASQNEWLLSPELTLSEGSLSFWSQGSVYWCRDDNDNCDLNIWIVVGSIGGGDDILVGKAEDDWPANWTWTQSTFNLDSLLPGGPVRIGFQYFGADGAQIVLDEITLDGTEGSLDIPWLSVSPSSGSVPAGASQAVNVTFDTSGLTNPGQYDGTLRIVSNDPLKPTSNVPVTLNVVAGTDKASPANGASDQPTNVTLSWNSMTGATGYEYCYSSAPGPCTQWRSVGTDTSVALQVAPSYTYYWQVRAITGSDTTEADGGSWWSFTTTATAACTWPAYSPPTSPTFLDVPMTVSHWSWVERLSSSGITSGCGGGNFCPFNNVIRAQMAIFLLRSKHCGSAYTPPSVGDSTGFDDVPLTASYAPWVKQLAAEGITAGCGGGNFCPLQAVSRAQMAIFLLRAKHGSTYSPPALGSDTGFGDVPLTASYAPWVKQLAAEGITTGCGGGNFCPLQNVNRAQMATFLVRAFGLP